MKIAWNMFCENFKRFLVKNKFLIAISMLIVLVGIVAVPRIFAVLQPVKSVEIFSEKLNYNSKEPGAWKVTKSAKWIEKGVADITFDVDSIMKTNNKNTDVLLVLDISGSMNGDKLNRVKTDSVELIESLLSNDKNKVGLITFDSTSEVISDFINDKDSLINSISSLSTKGSTNYYKALINVDEVLKDYVKEKDKECVVLFLTDGYPNEETPNEEAEYNYLKSQYPFVTINGIQYEMGNSILEPIKKVSDNQFIANMDTLNNVLFEASVTPIVYDSFEITDYIDSDYFLVENEKDIKVSQGKVSFVKENQKVTWNVNGYRSGSKIKMTIKASLKNGLLSQDGNYPTNKKEEIKSELGENVEYVTSSKTPVLTGKYKVTYDANVPDGCNIIGDVPADNDYLVFDTVSLSDNVLKCDGYQFQGWDITTIGVVSINDDYFTMPEEDVVVRAIWSKLAINKSMDGEVREYVPATLEKYNYNSNYGLHKYKTSITDIIFQDSMSSIGGAKEVLDISAEKNNGILAYIVPNEDDSTKYTAYIQGDGSVIANSYSDNLFYNFTDLKSIQNLGYLDTSNVTNMSSMFYNCISLTSLDLSSFDTSSVTNMSSMFTGCSKLTSLDLSNFVTLNVTSMSQMFNDCVSLVSLDLSRFDTSSVTSMYWMFKDCSNLTDLDLSKFNTSSVTNMSYMLSNCSGLTDLDLGGFDTSSVTDMSYMFSSCSSLASLDLSSFCTSKVTNMGSMFSDCSNLISLNVSNFNTSKATKMGSVFRNCSKLASLDLSSFDTSSVTSMSYMFQDCSSLTSLNLSKFNTISVTDMNSIFCNCSKLTSLDLNKFNTSNVKNFRSMFFGCSSLTNLDLSNFDTSKVTSMSSMFTGCKSLISLNLSNFVTLNVTSMYQMFFGCSSLASLDLSDFNTLSVTDMSLMFSGCGNLTSLDLSNFNTSSVTDMSYMLSNCSSLTGLDLSNFDTSSVSDMNRMFSGCGNLTSLDLSNFNTSKVTNMYQMFCGCDSLQDLDISKFNTLEVTNMSEMFRGCSSLTNLDTSGFNTLKVTNMRQMFFDCNNLQSLDLSGFNTSSLTSMSEMFCNCNNLSTTLVISNKLSFYTMIFYNAATAEGAKITVNYTEAVADVIDSYIATKSSNSSVLKGELVTIGA